MPTRYTRTSSSAPANTAHRHSSRASIDGGLTASGTAAVASTSDMKRSSCRRLRSLEARAHVVHLGLELVLGDLAPLQQRVCGPARGARVHGEGGVDGLSERVLGVAPLEVVGAFRATTGTRRWRADSPPT